MILGKVKGLRWGARAIESVLGNADAEEATTESTDDFSDSLEDGLAKQGFPAHGYRRPSIREYYRTVYPSRVEFIKPGGQGNG